MTQIICFFVCPYLFTFSGSAKKNKNEKKSILLRTPSHFHSFRSQNQRLLTPFDCHPKMQKTQNCDFVNDVFTFSYFCLPKPKGALFRNYDGSGHLPQWGEKEGVGRPSTLKGVWVGVAISLNGGRKKE